MRITIIIPALNEADNINTILQALQNARSAGHQVVLVDGGSKDNTIMLAQPLVDIVVESEAGRAAQMNAGAAVADAEILWFLHADTMIGTDSARLLLDAAIGQSSSEFWGRFDVYLDDAAWPCRVVETMMNMRSRLTSVATGDQGIFVSRQLHISLGGFAKLPLMEDIEYSKRLRKTCRPINLSARIGTSSRRWKKAGVLRTIVLMWWLRLAYVCGVSPAKLAQWYQ